MSNKGIGKYLPRLITFYSYYVGTAAMVEIFCFLCINKVPMKLVTSFKGLQSNYWKIVFSLNKFKFLIN